MSAGTLTYQKLKNFGSGISKEKTGNIFKSLITRDSLLLLPLSFLVGRASILGGLMPFGAGIYIALLRSQVSRITAAISILSGMLTAGAGEQIYIVLTAIILYDIFQIPLKKDKPVSKTTRSVMGSIAVAIPQLVIVALQGFLLYDLLRALLYSAIVFLSVYIFDSSIPFISSSEKRYVYSNEEILCLAITAAVMLSGMSGIKISGLVIKNVLSILIILLFGYKCGPAVGSSIGVTVGLIVSMSGVSTPLIIGSYAFCGLLCGTLRNLGKIGSSLGFVMGNAVLTLYLNGSTEVLIYLNEIIAAVVLFIIVPQRWMDAIADGLLRVGETPGTRSGYTARIKEMTVNKLNKFSRAFKELSQTFNEISETQAVTNKQDISSLFDRVADKVCKDCSLCLHCWDRNFYNTYQVMFKIVEKLDAKGRIEEKDIPSYFMERCERISDFVQAVNNIYEIFKVDMVWKGKIGESRGLVSQQMEGLSRVISNLAAEIGRDVNFKADYENTLRRELDKAGIRTREVTVYKNKWDRYEITISHKGCGGKRNCISKMEKVVSGVIGRKMIKESGECLNDRKSGCCTLKMVEQELLKVTTGVAQISKQNEAVSGDSYTFQNTGDGKYIVALSDGMGSGQKAATQSRATISLLEQLMESGFDKDTSVKLINSVLVLKSTDESFATIDLSVIDLYEGEVEFVKIGAVPTFIKKKDRTEVVRSASLPAGILSNIELELIHKRVDNGDFVIMLSDGVYDSFSRRDSGEKGLLEFIEKVNSINPQQIADMILDEACANDNCNPLDDMIVLAAKVWKPVK